MCKHPSLIKVWYILGEEVFLAVNFTKEKFAYPFSLGFGHVHKPKNPLKSVPWRLKSSYMC